MKQYGTYESYVASSKKDEPIAALAHILGFLDLLAHRLLTDRRPFDVMPLNMLKLSQNQAVGMLGSPSLVMNLNLKTMKLAERLLLQFQIHPINPWQAFLASLLPIASTRGLFRFGKRYISSDACTISHYHLCAKRRRIRR